MLGTGPDSIINKIFCKVSVKIINNILLTMLNSQMMNSQTVYSATNTDTNPINDCKDSTCDYAVNSKNHNHIGSNVNQTVQSLNYFPGQNHHSSQQHAVLSNLNPSNDANFGPSKKLQNGLPQPQNQQSSIQE